MFLSRVRTKFFKITGPKKGQLVAEEHLVTFSHEMLLAYCTNHITYYHTGGSTNPRPLKSTFVVPFSAFLVGHFVAVPAVSVLERVYSSIIEIGLVKPHFNTE